MAILVAAGGAAVGTLLFPGQGQDSRGEGPRLGDLTVTYFYR